MSDRRQPRGGPRSRGGSEREGGARSRGGPRGYPAPPKRKPRRIRTSVLVFCVLAVLVYAASILWPLLAGNRTWMWVDVIVFPFLVLIAQAIVFGDRTPDDSSAFWGGV